MINFKFKDIVPIALSLVLVGGSVAGCNNDAGKPQGVEAQKSAVIGGTPPPDVQKMVDKQNAENASRMAAGAAAEQAAAKAKGAPKP